MKRRAQTAFTIVELLVAMTVLLLVVAFLINASSQAGGVLQDTAKKLEQFREARLAFDSVTLRLTDATLNTYWDYTYRTEAGKKVPASYSRQSELRFRSGSMERLAPSSAIHRPTHGVFFQAPVGETDDDAHRPLAQALNTWGFFLETGSDEDLLPPMLVGRVPSRVRSRLYELREPTEVLSIYKALPLAPAKWYADSIEAGTARPVRVLAENIVALVILPRLSRVDELARGNKPALSPRYDYDSTHASNHTPPLSPADPEINPKNQLPPVLQVIMVAIDETSAQRLAAKHGSERDLGIHTDDLFQKAAMLEDNPDTQAAGDGDLHELESRLIAEHASYRIFSTSVAIRGAKWSRAQSE